VESLTSAARSPVAKLRLRLVARTPAQRDAREQPERGPAHGRVARRQLAFERRACAIELAGLESLTRVRERIRRRAELEPPLARRASERRAHVDASSVLRQLQLVAQPARDGERIGERRAQHTGIDLDRRARRRLDPQRQPSVLGGNAARATRAHAAARVLDRERQPLVRRLAAGGREQSDEQSMASGTHARYSVRTGSIHALQSSLCS
jgi:hypothetical protein